MKQHSSGFLRLVVDAKSRITEINASDLAKKMASNIAFYLIDVREQDEYKQGFIPQAIHLSKGIIERDIEKQIPDYTADIVVYCSGGFRSCLVADNLKKMGYQNVSSLTGGFRVWLKTELST
ncbi:MAG: rhodanese-like domain-containing protein [Rickettsiella sp.]|nr:rhodanese-like domain-containing protein [Rickettsiella sp.]